MFRVLKDINHNLNRSLQNDPAAHSKLEILLLYPHIRALAFHRVSHFLYKHHLFFLARLNSNIASMDRDRNSSGGNDWQRSAD